MELCGMCWVLGLLMWRRRILVGRRVCVWGEGHVDVVKLVVEGGMGCGCADGGGGVGVGGVEGVGPWWRREWIQGLVVVVVVERPVLNDVGGGVDGWEGERGGWGVVEGEGGGSGGREGCVGEGGGGVGVGGRRGRCLVFQVGCGAAAAGTVCVRGWVCVGVTVFGRVK